MSERIVIRREELFDRAVEEALAGARALDPGARPPPELESRARRLFLSSLFYLPVAGMLAALVSWLVIEPYFEDYPVVGGEVLLVNHDPMAVPVEGAISLTVGDKEVLVFPGQTMLEAGSRDEPAFGGLDELVPGVTLEACGEAFDGQILVALAVRPATEPAPGPEELEETTWAQVVLFPLTATLIALALLAAEGLTARNWLFLLERSTLGGLLTLVFSFVAFVPAGLAMTLGSLVLESNEGFVTIDTVPALHFVLFSSARSLAWAAIGAALGVGMNLMRSTRAQLRNSVVGGTLGGAVGGLLFDPIDRFCTSSSLFDEAPASRLAGLVFVGLCVGVFVALVDHLAREAWIRVRTGPLAGKSFVLYRNPTTLGSSPRADIYLFKDAEIEPVHARIHRVVQRYEIEDQESRVGLRVRGESVRRRRLESGDQIVLGSTVLEFEERARRAPLSQAIGQESFRP